MKSMWSPMVIDGWDFDHTWNSEFFVFLLHRHG